MLMTPASLLALVDIDNLRNISAALISLIIVDFLIAQCGTSDFFILDLLIHLNEISVR